MNHIETYLNTHREELCQIAQDIFCHPEPANEEFYSSRRLADYLQSQGFTIEWNIAGLATAFAAKWGSKSPHIGFLAEYDALPGVGHACGHNLLGTGVCAAACALKEEFSATGKPGTIYVYGCPAEEILFGKVVMNKAGVFDHLDACVTWHPFDRNRISNDIWQSQDVKTYTFHGIGAHASLSPEDGRSALDAAELMNVGVNYLREHVPSDARMHYAYIDNNIPPNVVPDVAGTTYYIRAARRATNDDVTRRVDNCAKGAALMTGTTVEIQLLKTCQEMKINRPLTEIYYEAMTRIPTPEYTADELMQAARISEEAGFDNKGVYFTGLEPLEPEPVLLPLGTDASEVSHTIPLITISAATMCKGTPLHHWATREQAGCSIGHKGMLYAARCMAEGTKLLIETDGALDRVWKYHRETEE